MCRHLAHLGPPIALHEMLFGAPHSLCTQARHPRHQEPGDTNADGWGVGWYIAGEREARRHRTITPMWHDSKFAECSRGIESGAFVAAARRASPGATIAKWGNAPFRSDQWLFSLNGVVKAFREGAGDALLARVSERRRAEIVSDTDSEVLFALALHRLDQGAPPAEALAGVVEEVRAVTSGRLNLVLADGVRFAATRLGSSLFLRDATIVSEPLDDDPRWREVPECSIVVAVTGPDGAEISVGSL